MTLNDDFTGFQPLDANFIHTPNQFLDLCIPNCSLVAIRAIGHVLYETHRWRDSDGQLEKTEVQVPQSQLEQAGVGRSCRAKAIQEGIDQGFLRRLQDARRTTAGEIGQSEVLALNWDDESPYLPTIEEFRGFFSGDGHRTPLPEAFYTTVIPTQPLNVIKWVAAVFRYSVGYEDQFGRRREKAKVSTRFVERYANIKDHKNGLRGRNLALERGFIVQLEEGSAAKRQAPTYGPKWLSKATADTSRSNQPPACLKLPPVASDAPDSRSKQPPDPVRNSHQVVCEKNTAIKETQKETVKQQHAAVENQAGYQALINVGFEAGIARKIAANHPATVIEDQIRWLSKRKVHSNVLGMLRRAIEERWSKPTTFVPQQRRQLMQTNREPAVVESEREQRLQTRRHRLQEWQQLNEPQQRAFHALAEQQATTMSERRRLQRHRDLQNPLDAVLAVMVAQSLPIGESA